jgi:HSP20 family protein
MNLIPGKSRSNLPVVNNFTNIEDNFRYLQKEMNSLMNNFFNQKDATFPQTFSTDWYPSIDLKEEGNKYLVDADVPGVNEADLDIDFHDNILTIKGETKNETKKNEAGYVCVERSQGAFRRDIYLDKEVDKDSIKADLRNGVLHIEMIKNNKTLANHKKIPIKH